MSIQIQAIVNSNTINSEGLQIFNRDNTMIHSNLIQRRETLESYEYLNEYPFESVEDSRDVRSFFDYSVDSFRGQEITAAILQGDFNTLKTIITEIVGDFYADSLIQIKISGLTEFDINQNAIRTTKRVKNYLGKLDNLELDNDEFIDLKTRSYVKPENLLNKYRIFKNVKKIPYYNYDDNINPDSENCFSYFLKNHYNKLGDKTKEKFNKLQGVTIQEVIDFTNKYKIKCALLNIASRIIYKNNFDRNKNYPNLNAIITSNHIYPLKRKYNSIMPRLDDTINSNQSLNKNHIMIQKNNKIYSCDGVYRDNILSDQEIDRIMFNGLKASFFYDNDITTMRSLHYTNKNIDKSKYEYDMNKAFFNIAYKIIDPASKYPVFTLLDMWKPYKKQHIDDLSYYVLTKNITKKLKRYGFKNNYTTGFIIKILLDNELISKNDIEYYKKPTYEVPWGDVLKKLQKLIYNYASKKLNKKLDEINDDIIKQCGIDSEFVLYNGILGKCKQEQYEIIYGLDKEDYELLNYNSKNEIWEMHPYKNEVYDDNSVIFKKRKTIFKNASNVSIYNHIIQNTNKILLLNILHIKKEFNVLPLKINTDSITYDREINLIDEHIKYFKLQTIEEDIDNLQNLPVKNKKIFKMAFKSLQKYFNVENIIYNITSLQKEKFKDNISFQGHAGTGKTTKIKGCLRYNIPSIHYDISTTVTNVCALNMSDEYNKAKTTYSLFGLYDPDLWFKHVMRLKNRTLWLDEYSMVPKYQFNFIILACIKYNCKLILTGDINQIPPVKETQNDISTGSVLNKLFNKIEVLKKDYRNDKKIIELREYVLNNNNYKLYDRFRKLNCNEDWRKYNRHIVVHNTVKNYINTEIVKDRGYTFKFNYDMDEHYKSLNHYKSLDVSNGVYLTCRATNKKEHIYKNDIWIVKDRIYNTEDSEGNNRDEYLLYNVRTKTETYFDMDLMFMFNLGYATTVHSAQGLTINEPFCIHEISSMIRWDKSILYTAITRGTTYDHLKLFYNNKYNKHSYIKLPKVYGDDDEEGFNKGQQLSIHKN